MAKVVSKGTVFQVDIASTLTAVAQLTDISSSGNESETYDSTTLDGAVAKTYGQTGFTEPGTVDISGFYDPVLSTHTEMRDLLDTPADKDYAIVYADSGTTTKSFTGAGISFEDQVTLNDGVKFSCSIKLTGAPTYA